MKKIHILIFSLALCLFALPGCGENKNNATTTQSSAKPSPTSTQPRSASTEQPVPIGNSNQASGSDIPDTQVFVTYTSSVGNYQLEVPEGWAQTTNNADVQFVNNLNALQVAITDSATQPTASSVRNDPAALQQIGRAVRDIQVQDVHLPSGSAVLITYTSNSDPNAVTGKQVRLENDRYLIFHNGKLATLTLSAPVGADNVDQWKRIANSFKWG